MSLKWRNKTFNPSEGLTNVCREEDDEIRQRQDPKHAVDECEDVAALEASRIRHRQPKRESDGPEQEELERARLARHFPWIRCAIFVASRVEL